MNKKLINIKSLIGALNEIFLIIKDNHKVLYFPDSGGTLLLYIFKRIVQNHNRINKTDYDFIYYTSKITALSKINFNTQLLSILTEEERQSKLTNSQKDRVKNFINSNPKVKNHIDKTINIEKFIELDLFNIIMIIGSYGLFIPSEDENNLTKIGILNDKENNSSINGVGYNNSKTFANLKKKLIPYIINNLDNIEHPYRDLLNIILENTEFALTLKKHHKIYIVDEAISRGRTLNSFEVILKSFYKNIDWQIGVLYSSDIIEKNNKVSYIYSNNEIPFFSNRFDLIGKIVAEDKIIKVLYVDNLLSNNYLQNQDLNKKDLFSYNNLLNQYIEKLYVSQGHSITKHMLKKLLLFLFAIDGDHKRIENCLSLKTLYYETGLIEENDFYINLPNPFKSIVYRKNYISKINNIVDSIINGEKNDLYNEYYTLKKAYGDFSTIYQKNILKGWIKKQNSLKSKINDFI